MAQLQTGLSQKIDAFMMVRGTRAQEKTLHDRFSAYRTSGEWFAASGPLYQEVIRAFAMRTESEIDSEKIRNEQPIPELSIA
jgi:hypothetical protein